ncbi:MAG: BolA/IbaG family iron-sulfur metabolism protein [Planctomycetota bacterium]
MLLSTTQLKDLLERTIPQSQVQVRDLTGTSDHFAVDVTSPVFAGKSLVEQHKIVQAACGAHLGAAIHAIQIKTRVPN